MSTAAKQIQLPEGNKEASTIEVSEIDHGKTESNHFHGIDLLDTDLQKLGKIQAYFFEGSIEGLLNGMRQISFSIENKLSQDILQQDKYKQFVREEIRKQEHEKQSLEQEIEQLNQKRIPMLKEQIEKTEQELKGIKSSDFEMPQIKDKVERLHLRILSVLLIALSIYLLIFYSSAFYSAFFKDFKPDELGLSNLIFEPQAFSKALEDGVAELLLILFVPFLFLGLGFVVHRFWEQETIKGYLRSMPFVLITFVF